MRNIGELYQKRGLPLIDKIKLTKKRIREWYEYFGGNIYISFSGGKDSNVLLHIARQLYPNIKGLFCDTGLEYPEVKDFIKTINRIEIIRPEKNFKEVIEKFGWVFPSKDVAQVIYYARKNSNWAITKLNGTFQDGQASLYYKKHFANYKDLLECPFILSDKCCKELKEKPFDKYSRKNKEYPIIALRADESMRRQQAWIRSGCNAFNSKNPKSKPLSFWTEQDILHYIDLYDIPVPTIYGDLKENEKGDLYFSKINRTGCIFCIIGCHHEKGEKRRFIVIRQKTPSSIGGG